MLRWPKLMSSSQKNGWADLVDLEDEQTPKDGTPQRPSAPPSAPTKAAAPSRASAAPAPAKVTPATPLRLPTPGELTGGLSLDPPKAPALRLPVDTSERPTERLPPAPAAGFSNALLLDKLKTQPGSAAVTRNMWAEYRELILTGAIGMALLSAFIGYRAAGPEEPDPKERLVLKSEIKPAPTASPTVAPPSVKASPSATAAPPEAKNEPDRTPTPPAEPEANKAPSVAMLSVLSTPIGAEVLVNGEPAGVTPLIAKAPGNPGAVVHVRLMYPGYKPWDQTLTPNETGHYVANVTLEH